MKTSDIAIESIQLLEELVELLLNTENVDADYTKTIEILAFNLKREIFGNIIQHEYYEFYLRSKERKRKKEISVKNFIDNPRKTLELFQTPNILNSKKKSLLPVVKN